MINWPLKLAILSGRRIFYIHALHEKYGPFVRIAPDEIAVADPTAAKEVHRIGGGFTKTVWYTYLNTGGIGTNLGIFSLTDPKKHAQRRKLLAKGFSQNYIREQWEDTVRSKAEMAVQRIKVDATAGTANVLKWWIFMASDVATTLMFGNSFRLLELGHVSPIRNSRLAW